MKTLLILTILATTSVYSFQMAQAQDLPEDMQREITEGKIQASEIVWPANIEKGVSEKQQKALSLITLVAAQANERYGVADDSLKEDAEYAHIGFVARFHDIREDREALAKKEIQADYATLQNYSKRLDSLIADLQAFIK